MHKRTLTVRGSEPAFNQLYQSRNSFCNATFSLALPSTFTKQKPTPIFNDIMSRAEYIPLPSEGARGGQDNADATATCFCGAVQLLLVSNLSQAQRL